MYLIRIITGYTETETAIATKLMYYIELKCLSKLRHEIFSSKLLSNDQDQVTYTS
jgi:hypothetical protein